MDEHPHSTDDEEECNSINSNQSSTSLDTKNQLSFNNKLRQQSKKQLKLAYLGDTASISSCSCYQLVNNQNLDNPSQLFQADNGKKKFIKKFSFNPKKIKSFNLKNLHLKYIKIFKKKRFQLNIIRYFFLKRKGVSKIFLLYVRKKKRL